MEQYNKLIRDKIPAIIEQDNKQYTTRKLNDSAYSEKLKEKLLEEVDEYIESGSLEELADILEVLRSIANNNDVQFEEIEQIRKDKKEKRGGFEEQILLIEAEKD